MTLEMAKNLHTDVFDMQLSDISEVTRISAASEFCVAGRDSFVDRMEQINSDAFVARVQTGVIGFLTCYRNEDARVVALDNIAVTPELRRCSIGSQLIRHLNSHLQSFMMIDTIVVVVAETNLGGQLFLRENDFECTGIVPNSEWPNCDAAYIMHRPLR